MPGNTQPLPEDLRDPNSEDPLGALHKKELGQVLAKCLESLPFRQQQVILMYFYQGLVLREIGKRIGLSEARASQLRSAGLEALMSCLRSHGYEGDISHEL